MLHKAWAEVEHLPVLDVWQENASFHGLFPGFLLHFLLARVRGSAIAALFRPCYPEGNLGPLKCQFLVLTVAYSNEPRNSIAKYLQLHSKLTVFSAVSKTHKFISNAASTVPPIACNLLFLHAQCIETGEHSTGACGHYQKYKPVHYTSLLRECSLFSSDPCPGWEFCSLCCALHQVKASSGKTKLSFRHFLSLAWRRVSLQMNPQDVASPSFLLLTLQLEKYDRTLCFERTKCLLRLPASPSENIWVSHNFLHSISSCFASCPSGKQKLPEVH